MSERWILHTEAVEIIRDRLSASVGKSRAILKEACAAEVRVSVGGVERAFTDISDFAWIHGGMGADGHRWLEGVGRPLKINEDDLRCWLNQRRQTAELTPQHTTETRPASGKNVRGRKIGSGAYAAADAPLLQEMKALIGRGEAKSANDAARKVATRAEGNSVEAARDRLARKFRSDMGTN